MADRKLEELFEAWNVLGRFAGEKLGIPPDRVDDELDGVGTYYDVDNLEHWPDLINFIIHMPKKKEE